MCTISQLAGRACGQTAATKFGDNTTPVGAYTQAAAKPHQTAPYSPYINSLKITQ